jgi:hypothetical protein
MVERDTQRTAARHGEIESASQHPLEGFWLVYAFRTLDNIVPFRSIMSIEDPEKAALFVETNGIGGIKFEGDYLDERKKVEDWLRAEAARKGVQIDAPHPLYFRLFQRPVEDDREGVAIVNIPAQRISARSMTFTFDDSFHNYEALHAIENSERTFSVQSQVFTSFEVANVIGRTGFPQVYRGGVPLRYIEGQIWTHEVPIFEKVTRHIQSAGQKRGAVILG